jgi:serine/threonine protein kinase
MGPDTRSIDVTKDYREEPQALSVHQRGSIDSLEPSWGSSWKSGDRASKTDPQVAAALEEYLDALNSDSPPVREEFLDRHPTIAGALAECLSGLEFIQATGWQLRAGVAPWSSPDHEGMGSTSARLGDYRILRELGRGSMGVVYEARQVSLGRRVALKVLPLASAIDPRQRQRFLIESQAAAQLNHSHIVPIYAAGCDQGVHFYAMQYVDGQSLAEILAERRDLAMNSKGIQYEAGPTAAATENPPSLEFGPDVASKASLSRPQLLKGSSRVNRDHSRSGQHAREIARLGIQAAEALDHAHSLGVVHRDIKPANLMIDSKAALWITDFGLARFRGEISLTRSGDLVGTLRYMSPEQALARRGVVDQRTDIYALGLTIYEMLTLRPAFDGRDHSDLLRQIAQDEPIPPRRLNPAIPRDLETIVMKASCKEPAGRYATAQELADDLARFLNDCPILARRPTVLERSLRWARRHKQIVLTAVTVLVLALAGGAVVVGLQAKRTRQDLQRYILKSFPAIDTITMTAMQQASESAMGLQSDIRQARKQMVYEKALSFYEQAAQLPPTDLASRTIIARAHYRIGFTCAVMAYAWGKSLPSSGNKLAEADSHYRNALSRFEALLAEAPQDVDIRSHFADALGEWGLGWFLSMTKGAGEAEPFYQRALSLRRELVLDPQAEPSIISEEMVKLAQLSNDLAGILHSSGRDQEVGEFRAANVATCTALAARLIDASARRKMAEPLGQYGLSLVVENDRKNGVEVLRLALILAPDYAKLLNNLAWAHVVEPDVPPYDPPQAIEIIRKAISLEPKAWAYWNTLGVAAYRAGDLKTAINALEESMSRNKGGQAADFFFMAMTRWQQGQQDEARRWFDKAVVWTRENQSGDPELLRFQAEAARLLGVTLESAGSKPVVKH